jgi:Uri superfamily endonuclease
LRGAYVLVIKIEVPTEVNIKSLGRFTFQPGRWIYVGSAMGNGSTSLENRIRRHFRREKTMYWHIDYLLSANVKLLYAIWAESPKHIECDLAQRISSSEVFDPGPRRFGSSDCRMGCLAHIFKSNIDAPLDEILYQTFSSLELQSHLTKDGLL